MLEVFIITCIICVIAWNILPHETQEQKDLRVGIVTAIFLAPQIIIQLARIWAES